MGENAKGSAATVSGTPRSLISLKSIEKPCESRTLQKETGHQSRYALYQNWCPVMVPLTGLEPVRCCHRGILSPLRLPISPQRHAVTDAIIMLFRGFCQLGKSITAHLFSACQRHVARSIDKKRPGTLFNHRRRLYRLSAPVCCDTVGRKQNRNCHNHNETRRYATLKRTNSRNALLFSKP